jgi:CheY-like chemotaxis protein
MAAFLPQAAVRLQADLPVGHPDDQFFRPRLGAEDRKRFDRPVGWHRCLIRLGPASHPSPPSTICSATLNNGSRGSPAVSHSILIIDDEDDIREVAALSLETVAGWRVFMANSGSQGLARAIEHQPEAILLDVMMPGMDGPTTFRELRKNPSTARIPVLLLTAKVQSSDQRRFADLGVEAILFKPFDPLTLSTQIAGILGWS